jgi:hypothetical protein
MRDKPDPRLRAVIWPWIRRHGFVVSVDSAVPSNLIALYDDAYAAGAAAQRELDAQMVERKLFLYADVAECAAAIRAAAPTRGEGE